MERLQKYLARCGVASRRATEEMIRAGDVAVNGAVVTELGVKVDPDRDQVAVKGRPVRPPTANLYLAVNKPPGVVTTVSDPRGRPTVTEIIPNLGRLYPVGRLDADSEGLVLMTNDGELAHRLMHPRYGCEKEYRALLRQFPDDDALERLERGILLDDGPTAPARVEMERSPLTGDPWVRLTLREGRKRLARRMLAAVGYPVVRLQRVRIGSLELGAMPLGASRPLGRSEVVALRRSVGLEA